MEAIVPYLMFNGEAANVLAFYTKALEGTVVFQQTYADSGQPAADEEKDHIMHATFQAGSLTIMMSDVMKAHHPITTGNQVSLSLNFLSVENMEKVFNGLSEGATITMPLQDTFWGARFGQLTDQFGINWMFNHDYAKKD